MFTRTIDDEVCIKLAVPYYAEALFRLTDENRTHLRRWLPWLDATTEAAHTRTFLECQLKRFAQGQALCVAVFYKGDVVGVADFNTIDVINLKGEIGYWLAEKYTGRGIMTRVVGDLIELGRQYYGLRRFEIRCASENHASRAIPIRLGFRHEGTMQQAAKVYDQWFDMEIYALVD